MEYGCIGEHLSHSFSAVLHRKIGSYPYELREIEPEKLGEFLTEGNFQGINVTIPYKTDVIPYLARVEEPAGTIGAVNTIVNRPEGLVGYNTDFEGMKALIGKLGLSLRGKSVLILGTGGTSKTACAVAQALGASRIRRVSRGKNGGALSYEEAYRQGQDVQILLNTTPCGMFPKAQASPAELSRFPNLEGVADAIYNPLRSRLVLEARERGIPAGGGLYMLTAQAAAAAEKFFGKPLPGDTVRRVYSEILREKENLVLIGMPGSGKSTVGRMLSRRMNKEFLDTDRLITEKFGAAPDRIIREQGTEEFRRKEAAVIEEISVKNNCVIATGGGAVLNPENLRNLKANGSVFWLDRPVELIRPTRNRPLSSDRAMLEQRFREREALYRGGCDRRVENAGTAADAARNITDAWRRMTE